MRQVDEPFSIESWLSPPAWKSYRATNKLGSSWAAPCCSRFSLEFHFARNGLLAWKVPPPPLWLTAGKLSENSKNQTILLNCFLGRKSLRAHRLQIRRSCGKSFQLLVVPELHLIRNRWAPRRADSSPHCGTTDRFQIMQFKIGYRYTVPDAKNCGNYCDRMHDMHMPESVGEHKKLLWA